MPTAASTTAHYCVRIQRGRASARAARVAGARHRHHRARAAACANWRICARRCRRRARSCAACCRPAAARFGAFLQRTDASMKTINGVLKKPAREADAFRNKLEETLDEVDRVRRDAAALKLTGLRGRGALSSRMRCRNCAAAARLSGSDFLPLAVKLDQLYGQFALLRSLTSQAGPRRGAGRRRARRAHDGKRHPDHRGAEIPAPKSAQKAAPPKAHRMAPAGSLDSTLAALTDLVAQEHNKTVVLECTGLRAGAAALSGDHQERGDPIDSQCRHARRRDPRRAQGSRQAAARHPAPRVQDRCRIKASNCSSRTTAAAWIRTRCAPPPSPRV